MRLIEELIKQPNLWVHGWRFTGPTLDSDPEGSAASRDYSTAESRDVTIREALLRMHERGECSVVVIASRLATDEILDTVGWNQRAAEIN